MIGCKKKSQKKPPRFLVRVVWFYLRVIAVHIQKAITAREKTI
jgi:hypothetical protein